MFYLTAFILVICFTTSHGMEPKKSEDSKKSSLFKRVSVRFHKSHQPATTAQDTYQKSFDECNARASKLVLSGSSNCATSEDACTLVKELLNMLCVASKTDVETIKRGISDAWTSQKIGLNFQDEKLQKQIARVRSSYPLHDQLITQFTEFLAQSSESLTEQSQDVSSGSNRGSLSVRKGSGFANKQEEMKATAWKQAEDDVNSLGIHEFLKEGRRPHYSIIKGNDGDDYILIMPDASQSHTDEILKGATNILTNNLLPEEYLYQWSHLLRTLRILISHYETTGIGEYLTFGLTLGFSTQSLKDLLAFESKCPQATEHIDAYINFIRSFRPASSEYTTPQKIAFIHAQTSTEGSPGTNRHHTA
jgi:hypothetical protein